MILIVWPQQQESTETGSVLPAHVLAWAYRDRRALLEIARIAAAGGENITRGELDHPPAIGACARELRRGM